MSEHQRIVVTGIGATTPIGGTAPQTWEALLAGTSGARTLDAEWVARYELPVTFAAPVRVDPADVLTRVETRRMDPSVQYAMIAAREAWADAGSPEVDPERLLAAVGTGIGGVHTLLTQYDVLKEKGPRRVYPLTVPMLMPNAASGNVSLEFKARAGAHTTVSACSSGAEAMGYAAELIRSGRADVAIAGGTEAAIHPLPIAGFAAAQALSKRNDDPQAASRPWAPDRDGFLLGEGAAIIVLESYEHARARGARIYAELASIGMSADAYHLTAGDPEGTGAARAMTEAVERAGRCRKERRVAPGAQRIQQPEHCQGREPRPARQRAGQGHAEQRQRIAGGDEQPSPARRGEHRQQRSGRAGGADRKPRRGAGRDEDRMHRPGQAPCKQGRQRPAQGKLRPRRRDAIPCFGRAARRARLLAAHGGPRRRLPARHRRRPARDVGRLHHRHRQRRRISCNNSNCSSSSKPSNSSSSCSHRSLSRLRTSVRLRMPTGAPITPAGTSSTAANPRCRLRRAMGRSTTAIPS